MKLLIRWLLCAGALMLVGEIFRGIRVRGFGTALIATLVIALINMLLGPILQFLAIPITIVTLGLFMLVVNGFLFWLASRLVTGFEVRGGCTAIGGSIVYSILVYLIYGLVG
jgi:putative membrane protein